MNIKENLTATGYFPERGIFVYHQPIKHLTYGSDNGYNTDTSKIHNFTRLSSGTLPIRNMVQAKDDSICNKR